MARRSTKPQERWRDTDALPLQLADHVSDLIASPVAKPTVIVLQSAGGRGKTYVAQRLFDLLAQRDPTGFWRPGLTPSSLPADKDALLESRKRIHDPALRDVEKKPDWYWYGLSATRAPGVSTSGDSVLSELSWQLQSAIRLMRARRFGSTVKEVLSIGADTGLDLGVPGYGPVKTAIKSINRLLELFASESKTPAELDEAVEALIYDAVRKALTELTALQCTSLIVLDDAHLVRAPVLHALAGTLVNGPLLPAQGRYFDTASPASDRRVIIVATSWSKPDGAEFWRWLEELQSSNVQRLTYREKDGWFSGLARERAIRMFVDLAPSVSSATATKIVDRVAIEERISPLLLINNAVETVDREFRDDEDADEFIATLPTTVDEIAGQKYARLDKAAKDAVVLAGALGYEFPLQALRFALARRLNAKAETALQQLIDERYLIVDEESCQFGNELDYGYARAKSSRARWVKQPLIEALEEWFAEFLDDAAHDLERGKPLPFIDLKEAATSLAHIYRSRSSATGSDLWNLCQALVDPNAPVPDEVPTTFAQLFTWSLRQNLRVPGDILRLANDLAPRSRTAAVSAIRVVTRRRAYSAEELQLARSILENNLSYLPAAMQLAADYRGEGRREEAKAILTPYAAIEQAAVYLAELYAHDRQFEEARNVLTAVAHSPAAATKLARLYVRDGKMREAKEVLTAVASHAEPALELTSLYLHDRQRDQAKQALALAVGSADTQMRLAELHLEDGQREAAKAALASVDRDPRAQMKLADLYVEDGQQEEAKRVLAAVAHEPMAAMQLTELLIADKQREKARTVLAALRQNSNAQIRLAELHVEDGQRDEAKNVLAALSQSSNAQLRLAELHLGDGARAAAKQVLADLPDNPNAQLRLAALLVEEGKREEAKKALTNVAHIAMAAPKLAELYVEDGERDRAKAVLEPLIHERGCARKLASLFAFEGDFERTMSLLKPHIHGDPLAALMMARHAHTPAATALAQSAIVAHVKARRHFVFVKVIEHLRSADDVVRVFPEQSPQYEQFWRYLYEHGGTDPRTAALYAVLTARSYPHANDSAVRLTRAFLPDDLLCACAMSELRLSPADAVFVRDALSAHAEAGHRSALAAFARLALKSGDRADASRVAALLRQQADLTDAERTLYAPFLDQPQP